MSLHLGAFQDAAQEHLEVLKAMSLACLRQSMVVEPRLGEAGEQLCGPPKKNPPVPNWPRHLAVNPVVGNTPKGAPQGFQIF